jgi:hypothetical protein
MRPYYSGTTLQCSLFSNMTIATDSKVSCQINDKGSVIVSSAFSTVAAKDNLQIKVQMMNPFKDFKCLANSKNVF